MKIDYYPRVPNNRRVGIIGGLGIVIIFNNRGVGRGGKDSVGGFLVLIC